MNNEEKNLNKTVINWFPGHMAKAISEIKNDLKLIDIVLVILDARVPYVSLNKEIYELVKSKTVIMALNKKDLASSVSLKKACKKYNMQGVYTVCTNSITGEGIDELLNVICNIGEKIKYKNKTSTSYIGVKKMYRVLVTGIPNVGKSSVINKMSGRNIAQVGNRAGVTKQKQWIRVGKNIEVMDTPGLFPKSVTRDLEGEKLAICGNIKEEVVDNELLSYTLINLLMANDLYKSMLQARYNLDSNIDHMTEFEILKEIGIKRGNLKKENEIDVEKTARMLLEDFRNGRIGKISLE